MITPEIKLEFFLDKIMQYKSNDSDGMGGEIFGLTVQRFRECHAYRNSKQSILNSIFKVPHFSEVIQNVWDASRSNPIPVNQHRLLDLMGYLWMISDMM